VWAIEMSRLDMMEAERTVKTVVLCIMVGLLMGLLVATVIVYEEASPDHPQTAGIPKDRAPQLAETTTRRPHE